MKSSFCPIRTDIKKTPAEFILDEEPVFRVGETIMHPSEGVCSIEALKHMDFANNARRYYVLKPVSTNGSSTVYLPVGRGNLILRRLLNQETIIRMIREAANHESLWISDNKQRKEAFTRILSEGYHVEMIRLILEMHEQEFLREKEGKKLSATDKAILDQAERRLHQEFSHVLHMTLEETVSFIRQNLDS